VSYDVYVCNPGTSHLSDGEAAEPCRCKHARVYHWWGGGSCGECDRCDYFRARPTPGTGETQ
jgi:hypothetical protein